jgi:hypothetical protein
MADSADMLGVAAQVAVTLAGFAGVVVVFGSGAVHEWSPVDRFRLRLMLSAASVSLAFCLAGLLLSAADLASATVWSASSAIIVVVVLPGFVANLKTFRKFSGGELAATAASKLTFYSISSAGIGVFLLQIYNVLVLQAFWPFFAAIVLGILASTVQFARLILIRGERG